MTGLRCSVRVEQPGFGLEVDLDVPAGQTVALVGPNGAGKTTLVRALAGLVAMAGGRVELDGEDLTGVPPERRPVGVVFQDQRLFPHLSVLENVAFGLRARGERAGPARRRALRWLEQVGLADRAGDRPASLSGGQAQRVALARALATEPRLLLLDEPLSALDASSREATRQDLRRHLDGYAGVRLLVTHDPVEAAALADRLVVLEGGRVVQDGTPAEVAARPRSRFVADLVGVNLFHGRVVGGVVHLPGGATLVAAGADDGDCLAVVHPRAVTLSHQRPATTARNAWAGSVLAVEASGDRARVVVDGPVRMVAEVTVAALDALDLRPGAPVWVSVKATEVAVYP